MNLPEGPDATVHSDQAVTKLNTDISSLSQAQLYDLNQNLLNDSVPSRPLIDQVSPMTALREEYENGSESFVKQIDSLIEKGYKAVRRAKGSHPPTNLFMT